MHLHELEAYLHLARTLHYGRASAAAHLSPSALSRVVVRLEQECGHPLFERTRRSVQLTAQGEAFRAFAEETLSRWHDLRIAAVGDGDSLRGDLTLYGSVTAGVAVLPPLLAKFRHAHPGVTIHLRTGDVESAFERVYSGDVDVAVAIRPDKSPAGLRTISLATTELEFIVPRVDCPARTAARQKRIDWTAVPFIAAERGISRQRTDRWFRARKARPNIVAQVSGGEAILGMVALGFGVGVVSRLVIDSNIAGHHVDYLPVNPRLPPFEVVLVSKRLSPSVSAFLDLAKSNVS